ncbi:hypothetical protein MAUB_40790 [Mycolicibacterium aubagnense]|uniref:DUF3558 domain-containing protein n=2 Tax=Mycolicibacterium aubagnense TaxID=319707 RepID=A0ABN5YWD8_9MYCO|nr:hypothetical protein C1S80_03410 [Mycolicibacterium aubagnense]BBX86206.1 hypothetical protein MAUB_40790 [Mycolicibacterium aubagnense]
MLVGAVTSIPTFASAARADDQASACPATGPGRGAFPFPVGQESLMVAGTPISALVCRYAADNVADQDRHLVGAAVIDGGRLSALVADLNAVGPNIVVGRMSCPYDDGQQELLIIDRADDDPAYVTVDLLGCSVASNGTLRSMLRGTADSPGERVRAVLAAAVGPPAPPRPSTSSTTRPSPAR